MAGCLREYGLARLCPSLITTAWLTQQCLLARFVSCENMASSSRTEAPFLQRLYDRIWLLALAALLFWALSYVLWGLLDVLSVPPG